MARKFVVIALLVCFVLVGLAIANEAPAGAPESQNNEIGNTDTEVPGVIDDGFAVAGPVGGPVPEGAFDTDGSSTEGGAPAPGKSGAAALEMSALAGLAMISGFFLF